MRMPNIERTFIHKSRHGLQIDICWIEWNSFWKKVNKTVSSHPTPMPTDRPIRTLIGNAVAKCGFDLRVSQDWTKVDPLCKKVCQWEGRGLLWLSSLEVEFAEKVHFYLYNGVGREAIEGLHFLASLPLAGAGREKTQPFNRFHSRLLTMWGHRMLYRKWNNAVQPSAAHSAHFPFPVRNHMSLHGSVISGTAKINLTAASEMSLHLRALQAGWPLFGTTLWGVKFIHQTSCLRKCSDWMQDDACIS